MSEKTLTRSFNIVQLESAVFNEKMTRTIRAMETLWPTAKITQWYDMSMDAMNVTARWEEPE